MVYGVIDMKTKSYEIDMCNGTLLDKIFLFTIPLMLSSILQLLFNAADIVIVGRFVGPQALAAVGSTGPLVNLLLNVFTGFSLGSNILVSKYIGSGNKRDVSEVVHTSVTFSVLCGIVLIFIGMFLARPLLLLMGTPEDVIDQATLYIQIYFSGMPVLMLHNFCTSILRAVGDTKRPLYYLVAGGVINVLLNIFFVTQLHIGVAGVALATVLSFILSAGLTVRCLVKSDGMYKLDLKKLRIHKHKLRQIVQVGLPAGLYGVVFSLSNMVIQSSINSFGSIAMAGSTAAGNIEGFIYMAMNAFHSTALSFTAQNYGAGKIDRVKRIFILCLICVTVTGLVMGIFAYIFGHQLLGIYSSDAQVIKYGLLRMAVICTTCFSVGIMEVLVGVLRGLGCSVMPTVVSIIGACGVRILVIYTIFQIEHTLTVLYLSYPLSWGLTSVAHLICFIVVYKRLSKSISEM